MTEHELADRIRRAAASAPWVVEAWTAPMDGPRDGGICLRTKDGQHFDVVVIERMVEPACDFATARRVPAA